MLGAQVVLGHEVLQLVAREARLEARAVLPERVVVGSAGPCSAEHNTEEQAQSHKHTCNSIRISTARQAGRQRGRETGREAERQRCRGMFVVNLSVQHYHYL